MVHVRVRVRVSVSVCVREKWDAQEKMCIAPDVRGAGRSQGWREVWWWLVLVEVWRLGGTWRGWVLLVGRGDIWQWRFFSRTGIELERMARAYLVLVKVGSSACECQGRYSSWEQGRLSKMETRLHVHGQLLRRKNQVFY